MVKNEKGFILPMTFIICTMVIFFFVSQVDLFMLDSKYYAELEKKRVLDNVMDLSMIHVKEEMENGIADSQYSLLFDDGVSNVSIHQREIIQVEEVIVGYIYQVYITCIIEDGQYSLVFQYDTTQNKIYNLVEGVTE